MTRLSGNETEMLCLKAARGAGMEWGMAEEAGFAVRWLRSRRIDATAALSTHLAWMDGRDWASVRPRGLDVPPGARLCPVALGAAISDAGRLPGGDWTVSAPVLLLPFLHAVAERGSTVAARWSGGCATVRPDGRLGGDAAELAGLEMAVIGLFSGAPLPDCRPGPPADATVREALDRLALRTAVPVSAASQADAGE